MQFLIDADLPESLVDILVRHGHDALHVRSIGLGRAVDQTIAARAQAERRCILTGDYDFSDLREYPPAEYYGIVVIGLPVDATISMIRILVSDFLSYSELVRNLRGKLVIVEPGRIRVRE